MKNSHMTSHVWKGEESDEGDGQEAPTFEGVRSVRALLRATQ
jgi:hypothetical protein